MKIEWIGFFGGNTGYGSLARSLVGLMDRAGIDVKVRDLTAGIRNAQMPQYLKRLTNKDDKDRKKILHQIPTVMPEAYGFYTVTEFDQPTYGSISIIKNANILLTQSNFCKEIFSEYLNEDLIHIVNYPIDPIYDPDGNRFKFNDEVEDFEFKFLSVFEWIMRKQPRLLIEAFCEEFDKTEDVCLVLRTWSKYIKLQKEIKALAKDHNVFWMPNMVADMPSLYRSCDSFVCPSAGEGWGHAFAEAMACGLPTIGPRSTGCLDYMNDNNAYLIDVTDWTELKDRPEDNKRNEIGHLIKPWFKFQFPEKESLKEQMRKVFDGDRSKVKEAVKIRDNYSFDVITKQLTNVFGD